MSAAVEATASGGSEDRRGNDNDNDNDICNGNAVAEAALAPPSSRTPWWRLAAVLIDRDVRSGEGEFSAERGGRASRARGLRTRGGWTGWVWRCQPLACIVGLAMRLSTFTVALWWSAWLGFWLAGGSAPAAFGMSAPPWLAALVMLGATAVGGAAGLVQELAMRRAFFITACGVLTHDSVDADLPASTFDRLRARDLVALPDHLTAAVDIVFTPLALVTGLAWLGLLFGGPTAGSGALAIGAALLVTGVVGVKSLSLAEPLVASGGRRMDLVSRWLDRRWFLLRWGRADRPLADIATAAARECGLMTRDSLWRGLEAYLSGFGIVFAVVGAVAARWLFDASPNGMLAFAWTLLPMIDAALSQARSVTQCGQATRLLESARAALGPDRVPERRFDGDHGIHGEHAGHGGPGGADGLHRSHDFDSITADATDADPDADADATCVAWTARWRLFDASLLVNLEPERVHRPHVPPDTGFRERLDVAAVLARGHGTSRHDAAARAPGFSVFDGVAAPLRHGFDPALDVPVVPFAISLLRHLRLADELWGDEQDDLEQARRFRVRDDGAELSAGQQVRVLFARAVLQARSRDLPLEVAHSLSALDAEALRRVREAPMLARIEVNWGAENLALFEAIDAIDDARHWFMPESSALRGEAACVPLRTAASPQAVAHRTTWRGTAVARAAASSLRWFLPMALLAATGLFALSRMLAARPVEASWRLLGDAMVVAVPSLLLVVAAGVMLERAMRRAALAAHAALLLPPGGDRSDLLQRFGRDFEVVTGRLAWYVHDLGWIAATAALGLLSMLAAFGLVGAAMLSGLALASVLLWRTLAPRVVSTRRLAAEGINRYLGLTANLRRLDGLQRDTRLELRRRFAARGLHLLWCTQAASIGSKGALTYHASLLGAATLAAVCVAGAWLDAPREALVFAVAALLTVNRLAATLVQGLAGLLAQSLSASRLCAALPEQGTPPDAHDACRDTGRRRGRVVAIEPAAADRNARSDAAVAAADDSDSDDDRGVELKPSCAAGFVLPASRNPIAWARYAGLALPPGSLTLLVGPSGSGKTQFLRHHAERAHPRTLYFPRETPALLDLPEGADWRAEVETIVLRAVREAPTCVMFDELTALLPPLVAAGWLSSLHRCVQARGAAIVVVDHRLKLDRVIRVEDVFVRATATAP